MSFPVKMAAFVRTFSLNHSQRLFRHLHKQRSYGLRNSSTLVNGSNQSNVEYPPVRPRWPPGDGWSNMTEKDAWALHEERLMLEDIPTAKLRLEKLSGSEDQMLVGSFPYAFVPQRTEYYRYITKTSIVDNKLPQVYSKMDVKHIISELKPEIETKLNGLSTFITLNKSKYPDNEKRHIFIGTILNLLVSRLSLHNDHLLRSQMDENCRVETFWRRAGYANPPDAPLEQQHFHFIKRLGTMFLEMMKYQYYHRADFQVRTELPTSLFVEEDDDLCKGESSDYVYIPQQMGDVMIEQRPITVSGAWINDPCEFTSLSVHCLGDKFEKYKKLFADVVPEHISCVALYTGFGSCVAQAHNQGFNWLMDTTYPFTTQSLVFDGTHIRLCAYQLNTMRLWVNDEANPLQNLAWISPSMELLQFDEEGKFAGINDEALGLIIKCLLMETSDRGVNLRPYLPEDPSPRLKRQYFNNKGEDAWEEKKIDRWEYQRESTYFFSFAP